MEHWSAGDIVMVGVFTALAFGLLLVLLGFFDDERINL
jgi:hypothetical protein